MTEPLSVETRRFGRIEARPEEVVCFPELPGFAGARRFVVREHDRDSVFGWLLSLDVPDLAFVIANPWHFFPDYAPEIRPAVLKQVAAKTVDDVQIVAIATVGRETLSLNLAAPIVINPATRRGAQVILEQDDYSTGALVPLARSTAPRREAGSWPSGPRAPARARG